MIEQRANNVPLLLSASLCADYREVAVPRIESQRERDPVGDEPADGATPEQHRTGRRGRHAGRGGRGSSSGRKEVNTHQRKIRLILASIALRSSFLFDQLNQLFHIPHCYENETTKDIFIISSSTAAQAIRIERCKVAIDSRGLRLSEGMLV